MRSCRVGRLSTALGLRSMPLRSGVSGARGGASGRAGARERDRDGERAGCGRAVWLPDGRRGLHLNWRDVRPCRSADERAPEQWPVLGMAKANRASTGNGNLTDPLPIHESAVRTPVVLQLPAAVVSLDN